jgi:hypothetical protein
MLRQRLPPEEDPLVCPRRQIGLIITETTGTGTILMGGRAARKRSLGRPRARWDVQSDPVARGPRLGLRNNSGVTRTAQWESSFFFFKLLQSKQALFLLKILLLIRPVFLFYIIIRNAALAICDICIGIYIYILHTHVHIYTVSI